GAHGPDGKRERRADRLRELSEPRYERGAVEHGRMLHLLVRFLRSRLQRRSRGGLRKLLRDGDQIVNRTRGREPLTDLILDVVEGRRTTLMQRVEASEVVAIVILKQLAGFAYGRTAEGPRADAWDHLAVQDCGLVFDRVDVQLGQTQIARGRIELGPVLARRGELG